MKKRGQITLFLIFGVIIVVMFGIFYYVRSYSAKSTLENAPEKAEASGAGIVKAYAESCIKNIAEDALFEKTGEQGGYIDVNANLKYGEGGAVGSITPAYTIFQGKNVPYYVEAKCNGIANGKCESWTAISYMPELDAISKKLANYIAVEFEECFKKNVFEDIGIKIEKPNVDYAAINFDFSRSNVNVEVNFNEEDTSIKMTYPLVVSIGSAKSKLDSFAVILPIRLKPAFEGSKEVVANMKSHIEGLSDTDYIVNVPFTIQPADCIGYVKKDLTNLYSKTADANSKIMQFMDYSTYYNYYVNSYIFQFGVKNIEVEGNCISVAD